jgi:FkbM family methyltransferase
MITTSEAKGRFINGGSEIEQELYAAFKKDERISIGDLGCCDGLTSIIYSRLFPNAKIHAFEPIISNCEEAKRNFIEYGIADSVSVYNCALSDREGIVDFFESYGQAPGITGWETGNKSSSLLPPRMHLQEHSWCKFKRSSVRTKTLDSFNLSLDFLHIDVQGAEIKVLRGGERTLSKAKMVWMEVAKMELYARQPLARDIDSFMRKRGFTKIKDTCGTKYGDQLWKK